MRRLVSLLALLGLCGGLVVFATGASNDQTKGAYRVRVVFRNAFSIIKGEDVKIAGVKVGKIEKLDLDKSNRRAIVILDITEAGFKDFRRDAECTIRPQSLIGEKFVECTPTQPRADASQAPPELPKITHGEGKGEYGPVTHTGQVVDIDLAANVLRLPYRQRLSLILNELGIGLAGQGENLNQVIRQVNPALSDTDKVLKILGNQNKVLAKLATDSDTILAPLAHDRDKVADFVDKSNQVNQATAERSKDLEANLQKLPRFLNELKPTMVQLGNLSDQASPVLSDLNKQAPSINRLIKSTGPFAQASIPALTSLGDASVPGREALVKSRPIVNDLRDFASQAKPLSSNLRGLLTSLKDTGGIERLMDYAFFQVAAINGFDAYGHYLRAQLLVNLCSTYTTTNDPSCTANFAKDDTNTQQRSARAALDAKGRSPQLAREDAVLRGLTPAQAAAGNTGATSSDTSSSSSPSTARAKRTKAKPALQLPSVLPSASGAKGTPTPTSAPTPAPSGASGSSASDPASGLLNYLLGGGA